MKTQKMQGRREHVQGKTDKEIYLRYTNMPIEGG